MSTVAEELARYADELEFDELDDRTVESTKIRILDSIACAVPALAEQPVERTRSYCLRKTGTPEASVVGTDKSASVEYAAMANGAALRFLDWNDTGISEEPGCGHPSDNIATVLAVADAYERKGADIVLATVLAYEIHCRLCDAIPLRRYGWDNVVYQLVASALAAGTLMELSKEELEEAVNIALSGHMALRQARVGELSDWKGLAGPNALRNAIVSAELASHGISGPSDVFEGKFGLFNQFPEACSVDTDAFGGDGNAFVVNSTFMKRYPMETHAHPAVECAQTLLDRHEIDPTEIESIECEAYEGAAEIIGDAEKWNPQTRETADHSLPYIVARTFLDGDIRPEHFSQERVGEPAVKELVSKITVTENPEFTERYGESMPHAMTVVAARETFDSHVESPKGYETDPFTFDDVTKKFGRASEGLLSPSTQDEIVAVVAGLEHRRSLAPLYELLSAVE